MNCELVGGFRNRQHGADSVGRLRLLLQTLGYGTRLFRYGFVHLPGVYLWNDNAARLLADAIVDGEVRLVVGFSNGCAMIHQALHLLDEDGYTGKLDVIYVSPALNRNAELARCVDTCVVLSTPKDWAVRLARWLPFLVWGDMGAKGPTSPDPCYLHWPRPEIGGHNEWWTPHNLAEVTEPAVRAACLTFQKG